MNKLIYALLIMLCVSCNFCENSTCDCFDEGESSIGIRFNTDTTTTNYFKRGELDSCLVIKLEKIQGNLIPIDTDRIDRYSYDINYLYDYTIWNFEALRIDNYTSNFAYRIYNKEPKVDILIDNIVIKGKHSGTCDNCQCYDNESIYFKANETPLSKSNIPLTINKD